LFCPDKLAFKTDRTRSTTFPFSFTSATALTAVIATDGRSGPCFGSKIAFKITISRFGFLTNHVQVGIGSVDLDTRPLEVVLIELPSEFIFSIISPSRKVFPDVLSGTIAVHEISVFCLIERLIALIAVHVQIFDVEDS